MLKSNIYMLLFNDNKFTKELPSLEKCSLPPRTHKPNKTQKDTKKQSPNIMEKIFCWGWSRADGLPLQGNTSLRLCPDNSHSSNNRRFQSDRRCRRLDRRQLQEFIRKVVTYTNMPLSDLKWSINILYVWFRSTCPMVGGKWDDFPHSTFLNQLVKFHIAHVFFVWPFSTVGLLALMSAAQYYE